MNPGLWGRNIGRERGQEGNWKGGHWKLFPTPALPLSIPCTPSCFFRLDEEEAGGQGCPGGGGDGRQSHKVQGGVLWEGSRPRAFPFPTDMDSPPQPGRVICGVGGSSSSLSLAFLPECGEGPSARGLGQFPAWLC